MSVTVAVQVVELSTDTDEGVQLMLVLVVRLFAVTVTPVLPELMAWVASPLYEAVIVWVPVLTALGV